MNIQAKEVFDLLRVYDVLKMDWQNTDSPSVLYNAECKSLRSAKIGLSGFLHMRNRGKTGNIASNQWRIGITSDNK